MLSKFKFQLSLITALLASNLALAGLNTVPGPVYGSQTNAAANVGFVGETITNTTSATNLPSSTATNAATVALTAGTWLVFGEVIFSPAGTTVITNPVVGISQTSGALGPAGANTLLIKANGAGLGDAFNAPFTQIIEPATCTKAAPCSVFLVASSSVTVSTATVTGVLTAVRQF